MDGEFKTATEDQFYSEFINDFFDSQSYFSYCIKNCLNQPLLISDNPITSILDFLAEFIEFLTNSKQTAQDLKEIAQLEDFEYVYSNLTNQIIRYDLKSLEESQLKKATQHISHSFLKDLYHILLTNKKSHETLSLYIDIKSRLRDLLNGSNGKHTNKNLANSLEKSDVKENSGSFEINASFNAVKSSSNRSAPKLETASIFSGLLSQNKNNTQNNENDIMIPGEENDEELLNLIQEIDSHEEPLPLNNFAETHEIEKNGSTAPPPIEDIAKDNYREHNDNCEAAEIADEKGEYFEDDDDSEIIFDESSNKIFHQEAILYYNILSNAILQLKNDEQMQSALEDIELTSSSLKQLAQKFGMEKLALLPELIESVCMLSNKYITKPPSSIIQGIEDGITLLKDFDVDNSEHRTKFMSILTLLKEYYMKTLHTTRIDPVTSQ